jgi:hypothetical protein
MNAWTELEEYIRTTEDLSDKLKQQVLKFFHLLQLLGTGVPTLVRQAVDRQDLTTTGAVICWLLRDEKGQENSVSLRFPSPDRMEIAYLAGLSPQGPVSFFLDCWKLEDEIAINKETRQFQMASGDSLAFSAISVYKYKK